MVDYNEEIRINIIKGQSGNMAWALVADKYKQDKHQDKNLDEYLEMYQNIYKKILEVNLKLLNGENKIPIKDYTIPAGGSNVPIAKINSKKTSEEREIGAAWPDRKDPKKVSIKHKETGEWTNVFLGEMETTEDGFKTEINGHEILLKKIKDRPNPKMPLYRVYEVGGD